MFCIELAAKDENNTKETNWGKCINYWDSGFQNWVYVYRWGHLMQALSDSVSHGRKTKVLLTEMTACHIYLFSHLTYMENNDHSWHYLWVRELVIRRRSKSEWRSRLAYPLILHRLPALPLAILRTEAFKSTIGRAKVPFLHSRCVLEK